MFDIACIPPRFRIAGSHLKLPIFLLTIAFAMGFCGELALVARAADEGIVSPAAAPALPRQSLNCGVSYYRVKPGDTLAAIARRAGASSRAVRQCNGLSSNVVYAGQILSMPGVVRTTSSTPQARVVRSYTPSPPAYEPSAPAPQAPSRSDNPYYTPQRPTPAPGR